MPVTVELPGLEERVAKDAGDGGVAEVVEHEQGPAPRRVKAFDAEDAGELACGVGVQQVSTLVGPLEVFVGRVGRLRGTGDDRPAERVQSGGLAGDLAQQHAGNYGGEAVRVGEAGPKGRGDLLAAAVEVSLCVLLAPLRRALHGQPLVHRLASPGRLARVEQAAAGGRQIVGVMDPQRVEGVDGVLHNCEVGGAQAWRQQLD